MKYNQLISRGDSIDLTSRNAEAVLKFLFKEEMDDFMTSLRAGKLPETPIGLRIRGYAADTTAAGEPHIRVPAGMTNRIPVMLASDDEHDQARLYCAKVGNPLYWSGFVGAKFRIRGFMTPDTVLQVTDKDAITYTGGVPSLKLDGPEGLEGIRPYLADGFTNLPKGIEVILLDSPVLGSDDNDVYLERYCAWGSRQRACEWHHAPISPVAGLQRMREEAGRPRLDDEFCRRWIEEWNLSLKGEARFRWADVEIYNIARSDSEDGFPYNSCMVGKDSRASCMDIYRDLHAAGRLRIAEIYSDSEDLPFDGHLGRALVWKPQDFDYHENGPGWVVDRIYASDRCGTNVLLYRKLIAWLRKEVNLLGYCYEGGAFPSISGPLNLPYLSAWSVPLIGIDINDYSALPYADSVGYRADDDSLSPNCDVDFDDPSGESNVVRDSEYGMVDTEDEGPYPRRESWVDYDGSWWSDATRYVEDGNGYRYPCGHHDDAIELANGEWAHIDYAVECYDGEWYLRDDCMRLHDDTWANRDDAEIVRMHNDEWALRDDCCEFEGEFYLADDFVDAVFEDAFGPDDDTEEVPLDHAIEVLHPNGEEFVFVRNSVETRPVRILANANPRLRPAAIPSGARGFRVIASQYEDGPLPTYGGRPLDLGSEYPVALPEAEVLLHVYPPIGPNSPSNLVQAVLSRSWTPWVGLTDGQEIEIAPFDQ